MPALNMHRAVFEKFHGQILLNFTSVTGRLFSTRFQENGDHIKVTIDNGKSPMKLGHLWLRDQCCCPSCYDRGTNQRLKHIVETPIDIRPISVNAEVAKETLSVVWADNHKSAYSFAWLKKLQKQDRFSEMTEANRALWSGTEMQARGIPTVDYSEFKRTAEGSLATPRQFYDHVLRSGLCAVNNVPQNLVEVKELGHSMCVVHDTFYGDWYRLHTEVTGVTDLAYGTGPLHVHTDGTFMEQTPGLMFMYGEKVAETGGESLFVDGFKAAANLKETDKASFALLANALVPHHYIEDTEHYKAYKRTINIDPVTHSVNQICFNSYDRATMPQSNQTEDLVRFYQAYQKFASLVNNPSAAVNYTIGPGTVVVYDNYRLLHGRTAFTGSRVMGGAYLSRDSFMSRARVCGLI